MNRILLLFLSFVYSSWPGTAQHNTSSAVFAHNDYVRSNPFYTAYDLKVGYIEADVFLKNGDLLVAHHKHEIVEGRTLEKLYLQPLLKKVEKYGSVYEDARLTLTLMIDLKTEGAPTLNAIVEQLSHYPALTSCPTLHFMISGNVPSPDLWEDYPHYIFFDGRPGIAYTQEQLQRISMISTNFNDHVKWNGEGKLPEDARRKLRSLMDVVHSKGKKIRFWASPDSQNAWKELMTLPVDVIVTDDVNGLVQYLQSSH